MKYCILVAILLFTEITYAQQRPDSPIAFTGARIYPSPSDTPIDNGVVIVSNGKIMSVGKASEIPIPKDYKVISCAGQTMTAGFWNTHVHFMEPKWNNAANIPAAQLTGQFQDMLTKYGFTSVVDIGSLLSNTLALRQRLSDKDVRGPRILTAGMIIYPKDGVPFYITETQGPDLIAACRKGEAATPADAVRIVDEQLAQGADVVKLMIVAWVRRDGKIRPLPMPLPVVLAATAEAHKKGKLVFAHPSTMEGVQLVLDGHVDILAHSSEESDKWDKALSLRLKAANVTLVPTLTLFDQNDNFDSIRSEVKSYADVGGQIMFGTDIGYLPDYPALTREFIYLSWAGLSFQQILASLTTVPAGRMGFGTQTGMIKKGMDADLVLMHGDPGKNVNAFGYPAMTVRAGKIIYQK